MPNPYPIRIQGTDGVATLNGEATFTDPANQPGGGGSQPVACVFEASNAIDLASGGIYFTWDTILDNLADGNELPDLPDGIGIDPASVGTDTLTTTEAGIWAFTLADLNFNPDATLDGAIRFGNYNNAPVMNFPVVTSGNRLLPPLSQVVNLPSGIGFSVGVAPSTPPTTNPFDVGGPLLAVVRLA